MTGISLNEFGDRMADLLPRLMQELWLYERNVFTRGEISFPQLWALEYLCRHGATPMRKLANAMHAQESTTTGLVDRLAVLKFVGRLRSRKDRRVVRAAITAKGRRVVRQIHRQKRNLTKQLFQSLSPQERLRHLEIVEKLVRGLAPAR